MCASYLLYLPDARAFSFVVSLPRCSQWLLISKLFNTCLRVFIVRHGIAMKMLRNSSFAMKWMSWNAIFQH